MISTAPFVAVRPERTSKMDTGKGWMSPVGPTRTSRMSAPMSVLSAIAEARAARWAHGTNATKLVPASEWRSYCFFKLSKVPNGLIGRAMRAIWFRRRDGHSSRDADASIARLVGWRSDWTTEMLDIAASWMPPSFNWS